jgi:NAD(P)-dependent dehydrogenase (short-subunit alcohol dehydrogenase family)
MKARPPLRKSEKRDLSMPERQIVVSGANRGIGAAIATELAAAGHCVVGLTRSGTSAAGTAVACDVGDDGAIARAIGTVAEQGSIAGLVNNAGLYEAHLSAELAAADFERIMRINATSMVVAARCVYPHLKRAGGGLIVNIGSYYDKLGVAKTVAYCASKAAVGAITRCLAVEWAADNIRVVNVAPGYIATELNAEFRARDATRRWIKQRIPAGRAGTPIEIGRLVAMLFTANVSYLTGETIYVDGGLGMNH